jgi:hypothetical protein
MASLWESMQGRLFHLSVLSSVSRSRLFFVCRPRSLLAPIPCSMGERGYCVLTRGVIFRVVYDEMIRGLRVPSGNPNDWPNWIRDVTFTPDGRIVALFDGKIVSIVDVTSGQKLFDFAKEPPPNVVALSPDGKTLCYDADNSFWLREIASGALLHKRKLAENVVGAAFSPDGRIVAVSTGENNARIHLIDVATGKELVRLGGHESRVRSLAFSPDGTKLATGQWDSTALIWDVFAARRKLPSRDLTAKDLERLWTELRDADAAKAHAALWALAAAPDKAVPFLKKHLQPVPRVADKRLRQLIADLDAEEFARREEASRELAKLGIEAEPALRKALEGNPSLELRRRVEALLGEMTCQTEMTPDALRQLRAIQVLEQIGSPQARQILSALAQGAPAAPATRDAAAALTRLDRRASNP